MSCAWKIKIVSSLSQIIIMKCLLFVFYCFILILCLDFSTQSNILGLFPHPGFSHFKVFSPILLTLAERGHNVTTVTYIKNIKPHKNYHELLLEGGKGGTDVFNLEDHVPNRSLWTLFMEYYILHVEGQKSCEAFYNSPHVHEIIRRHSVTPYDMVILEFFNTDCYLGLAYLLQVPIVGLSSCALMPWHYARVALPDTPSYIQSEFIGFSEELNWQERLINFVQSTVLKILYRFTEWKDNEVIKRHLNLDVDVREIAKTTSLVFVNQHYSLSGSRPLSAQVKEIGGVHIPEEDKHQKIPKDIDEFLNSSNESVLFISFGSMLKGSTISKSKFDSIVAAFKKLNLRVIWRWDSGKAPLIESKFIFPKWTPQLNVLCHPKVNYFWGHGGLLGTTEAVYCGKPMVVTPFYGDQFLNGKAVENRRVGSILNYGEISEEKVLETLREIMRPRYTENSKALSNVFRNREVSPMSTAVWWIEHVLNEKMGTNLLQTKAVNMNWFIFYSLDSIALLILSALLPISIIYVVRIRFC